MMRGLLAWTLFAVCATAWSAEGSWSDRPDLESRIQYSYYIEDRRTLQVIVDGLESSSVRQATRSYFAGLANYRLAQVTRSGRQGESRDAVQRCIENLDDALKLKSDFPDALALQAACQRLFASLSFLRSPVLSPRATHQVDKALRMAPLNPRVLLLAAEIDYSRPAVLGGSRARALEKVRRSITAFEAERRGVHPVPGWGAAEAYTLAAQIYLDDGDPVSARGALEQCLLIAPEFALARRLLARITSG